MGVELAPLDYSDVIGEERQRTDGSDRGVELTQRTGRSVAWVGKQRLILLGATAVQGTELRDAHVHLAAHLQ